MRVPEDWDRPCGGGSYYPPLRFPNLLEKSDESTAVLPSRPEACKEPPAFSNGCRGSYAGSSFAGHPSTDASDRGGRWGRVLGAAGIASSNRNDCRSTGPSENSSDRGLGSQHACGALGHCAYEAQPGMGVQTVENGFSKAASDRPAHTFTAETNNGLTRHTEDDIKLAFSVHGGSSPASCGLSSGITNMASKGSHGRSVYDLQDDVRHRSSYGEVAPSSGTGYDQGQHSKALNMPSSGEPELTRTSLVASNGKIPSLAVVRTEPTNRCAREGSQSAGRAPGSERLPPNTRYDPVFGDSATGPRRPCVPAAEANACGNVHDVPSRVHEMETLCSGEAPQEADLDVEVCGSGELPGRWQSWAEVAFPPRVRAPLISANFPAPTPIQQHTWPILALGRDLVGIAKTGSGKTLAFLLPAFSRLIEKGVDLRGPPSILVLAPTRELACQIEQEAKQFGAVAGIRAACLYGGAPKGPQLAELRQRPQVLVATPGRLNDLLEPPAGLTRAVDVTCIRYLVLDEADRMLDMGFEPQIRKIIRVLPQERQTLMFTATWPAAVRRLASEFMQSPVEVKVGTVDVLLVNPDVEQRVILCTDYREKEEQLGSILQAANDDQAIVFVNTKRMCESVALRISNSVVIHGDKDQRERDQALALFKSLSRRVLVATDVAARGLDIRSVRLVVNFDPPNREEDYVHRVGRTGRAGKKGTAVTLLTNEDGGAARSIAEIFKRMDLPVPHELERRLASGEMRARAAGTDRPRRLGGGRRGGGDIGYADDFDFDAVPGGRFSGGFGRDRRDDDFPLFSINDCPT